MRAVLPGIVCLLLLACSGSEPVEPAPLAPVEDPPELAAARARMVDEQVARIGVTSSLVLQAFRSVPRHAFLPESLWEVAYDDRAVTRPDGETITAPDLSGAMLQSLMLGPESRVLECGTRSGWLTALLAGVAAEVFTVDARPEATGGAIRTLNRLSIKNVRYRTADPILGWPEEGPFDAIVVNGLVPHVPVTLYESLVPGGRIVAPVGDPGRTQTLILSVRGETEPLKTRSILAVRFGMLARPE